MKQILSTLIGSTLLILNIIFFAPIVTNIAYAASHGGGGSATDAAKDAACEGIGGDCGGMGGDAPSRTINKTVQLAINIFSWIVGVGAVLAIIFGGFLFITSSGDSAKVGKAKDAILYAIIGLVVVAIAQVIVRFVLDKATAI